MSTLFQGLAVLVVFVAAVFVFTMRRRTRPARVCPPPRSRRKDPRYEDVNAVANLFLNTVRLKENRASWPGILQGLNPEDDPHTRTLLLELRALNTADPQAVLGHIERTCIASKQGGDHLTRIDLLERAKASMLGTGKS